GDIPEIPESQCRGSAVPFSQQTHSNFLGIQPRTSSISREGTLWKAFLLLCGEWVTAGVELRAPVELPRPSHKSRLPASGRAVLFVLVIQVTKGTRYDDAQSR